MVAILLAHGGNAPARVGLLRVVELVVCVGRSEWPGECSGIALCFGCHYSGVPALLTLSVSSNFRK